MRITRLALACGGRIMGAAALWLALTGPVAAADLTYDLPSDDDLADSLRAASLLAEAAPEGGRRDIVAAAQADYGRLLAVLFEAGHFGPTISITVDGTEAAALPAVGSSAPVGRVVVTVEAGPRFLFGEARIGPVPPGTELPDGFASGEPAGTGILREAATAGVEAWRDEGHAKAELASQDIVADHRADRLNAELRLDPGPRLSYGPVAIRGNEDVRTRQIARIADLRPGRVFDPDEIRAAAQRLQRTGAFSAVSINEAETIGPDATLPLTIEVVERLPRRFGFGAEVSSDDGLGVSAFWLHRNLTGYADSLRVEGEVEGIGGSAGGGEDYRLGLGYVRPSTFNPETDLTFNVELEHLEQPEFTSDRFGVEIGARRIVSDEFQYTYGIAYDASRTEDALGRRDFSILSLPLSAIYDRRDDPLNPADGYYVEATAAPFQGFERAGTGLRFTADLRGYQGFGEDRRTVAALRLQLGSVAGPDIDDIPAEQLFFSGGGGTVRGQPFQSLGVDVGGEDQIGGRSFATVSAELRRGITDNIGVVAFADWGFVAEGADWSDGDSHAGAGLGVRYNTGIGPIRFDIGLPVSGPGDNSGVEIYIGIGQAF